MTPSGCAGQPLRIGTKSASRPRKEEAHIIEAQIPLRFKGPCDTSAGAIEMSRSDGSGCHVRGSP